MTTEQLLQELRKGNYLREEALTKLQRDALLSGRSLEDLIYEKRLVDDSKMSVLGQFPEETVRTYGGAPLARKDDLLVVGMLHPDDVKAQEALRFIANQSRLNLGVYLISYSDWREMLRLYSPYKSNIEAAVRSLNLKPGETISGRRVVRLDEDLAKGGEEAPVIKIVADTFAEAIQGRASDIHFEPQESYLRVRFRVDGDLKEAASLPIELAQPIISRIN